MKGIFLQILYAFKRDSVFLGTTILIIICSAISIFIGSNAVVEANDAKIIYTAGFSRISIIIGFIIFTSFFIKRMFDNHEIEVILSHSISRTKVLIATFLGFSAVLSSLILPVMIILLFLKTNIFNILIWGLSVYMEGILMLSFTLCSSFILQSFFHSLTSSCMLYIIGRTIGNFVAYITLSSSLTFQAILANILKILSIVLPRLDLFGKTSWLVYGDCSLYDIFLFTLQTIIFCSIFLCIAIIDLKKKDF